MAVVVKPGAGKGKGYVVLVSGSSGGAPTITLKDGTVITGKYVNTVNEGDGPVRQYQFPTTLYDQVDITLTIDGKSQKLAGGRQAYQGDSVGGLKTRDKGSITSSGVIVGGGGLGGAQQVGAFGVAPADISGEFPTAVQIQSAPYNFTDPKDFAKDFGAFNTKQLQTNSALSKGFALDALDTELQGLKGFAPAAAALKQSFTAADNAFNQAERTKQIQTTIPDVLKDLNKQAEDARTYASGRAPNAVTDRGLELSDRAAAADQSSIGGFGARSSAARGVSDLMSAKDRIGLSQYGNSLLASNAEQRAQLELAPLEYDNSGSQINVNPTMSGSQLQTSYFGATNAATLVSPETALSSQINQNQFITNNQNAVNQFNANNLNNFALSLFNYKAGLANAVASAGQVSVNTGLAKDDQQAAKDEFNKNKGKTQKANALSDIIGAGGKVVGSIIGLFK